MTLITTRNARAADAPEIIAMMRDLGEYHGDQTAIEVEDLIFLCFGPRPWMTIILAEKGGAVVGYAALKRKVQLQFARRMLDVQHLFVKDEHRGTGVGRALIEKANEIASAERCIGVTLGVMAQNTKAQSFYGSLGFVEQDASGAIQLMRPLELHAARVTP